MRSGETLSRDQIRLPLINMDSQQVAPENLRLCFSPNPTVALTATCIAFMALPWRAFIAVVMIGSAATARSASEDFKHFNLERVDFQSNERDSFQRWVEHHTKPYQNSPAEYEGRFQVWRSNVAEHLSSRQERTILLNGLMDIHDEELRESFLGHIPRRVTSKQGEGKANLLYRYRYVTPAKSVDWRAAGIVGPIKNQHVNGSKCGCCWSFATIGVVESINALATGKMEVLSEQQLIACDKKGPYYDLGCKGGDFEGGMKYIIDNGGIGLESEYPYLAEDSRCNHRKADHRVVTIDAVEDVPAGNETALQQAVTMHPVGIGLCVGDWIKEWRAYTGGILKVPNSDLKCLPTENCEEPQDHAMPIVGYGTTEEDEEYWLLKNSWGELWGEEGFLKLPRGMPGNGSLGLAANPGYPVKISSNPEQSSSADGWVGSLLGRLALASGTTHL